MTRDEIKETLWHIERDCDSEVAREALLDVVMLLQSQRNLVLFNADAYLDETDLDAAVRELLTKRGEV